MKTTPTPFIIIAGSEKCGTTSLYSYLRQLDNINPSLKKETDYFRKDITTIDDYKCEFLLREVGGAYLEASPGYLTCSEITAPNIKRTLDHVKLVFLLRNPVDRFISSFNFHKSKFNLPTDMTLEDYFYACKSFYQREKNLQNNDIDNWYLDVLGAGKYYERLAVFYKYFSPEDILLLKFDDLKNNPKQTTQDVMNFAQLNSEKLDQIDFTPKNVGFTSKFSVLHKIAMYLNKKFETFWLEFPKIKKFFLVIYKQINAKRVQPNNAEKNVLILISDFYKEDQVKLAQADYETFKS
jgi:hypothetical protein